VYFFQLPAVKKDTIFGAARKCLGPSYFVGALDQMFFDYYSGRINHLLKTVPYSQRKFLSFLTFESNLPSFLLKSLYSRKDMF
jgi:hypothetical protein